MDNPATSLFDDEEKRRLILLIIFLVHCPCNFLFDFLTLCRIRQMTLSRAHQIIIAYVSHSPPLMIHLMIFGGDFCWFCLLDCEKCTPVNVIQQIRLPGLWSTSVAICRYLLVTRWATLKLKVVTQIYDRHGASCPLIRMNRRICRKENVSTRWAEIKVVQSSSRLD